MKRMRLSNITRLAGYSLLVLLAGCATTTTPLADKTLLDFLADGKTSKQVVILKLGQPSGTFEGERILTYRIGSDKERGYFLLDRQAYLLPGAQGGTAVRVGWAGTVFSLVLIFDESHVLQKHSLVEVR